MTESEARDAPKAGLADRLIAASFGERDGELLIGGMPVTALAEEFGTPLYVYDEAVMRGQLAELRTALGPDVDVYYSVKANPNPEIISIFTREGAGLEVASGAEYVRARRAGGSAERILFAGPGKSTAELEHVIAQGIGEIHLESLEEIGRVTEIARRFGQRVPVSIRINPIASAQGGAMRMGGKPAQFGFDEERLGDVVAAIDRHEALELRGIHLFAGTQILDADLLITQWTHAIDLARRTAKLISRPLDTVDLGGGLGVPYFPNESPLDLTDIQAKAPQLFATALQDPLLSGTRFILEPGRFLSGPGGVYLGTVNAVKTSREATFVITDAGMHHHLAASGNLGQVIKRDYPIVLASGLDRPTTGQVSVVGPLCTPLDTLGRKVAMGEVKSGDLVAVLQSGAYGLSASPSGFLSQPMPAEVLVGNGRARLIRPAGTFEQPISPLP